LSDVKISGKKKPPFRVAYKNRLFSKFNQSYFDRSFRNLKAMQLHNLEDLSIQFFPVYQQDQGYFDCHHRKPFPYLYIVAN